MSAKIVQSFQLFMPSAFFFMSADYTDYIDNIRNRFESIADAMIK